jgi:hypothetical protein
LEAVSVMRNETLRELTDPERDLDGDAQGDELEAPAPTKTKASRKK